MGTILLAQGHYEEAIDAFQGYLAQYPDGPFSANAQRSILDTRIQSAEHLARQKQFEKPRTAWQAFVTQNPLDARVPALLFRIGQSFWTRNPNSSTTPSPPGRP